MMWSEATVPRVSYVVLCWNSASHIERCVRSLARQAGRDHRDEILVVDNGSQDASPSILISLQSQLGPLLRLIRLSDNLGTTVSRNRAIRLAAGRYLAVVDSDVEVPDGAVDRLVADAEGSPRCGIMAPRLIYPDGRIQLSSDRFPTLWRKAQRLFWLRGVERREAYERPEDGGLEKVDYAIAAFWLMPRAVVSTVGLLDERIFYSPEDVDYCIRVWMAGYQVLYNSRVSVTHDAREISRRLVPNWASVSHLQGLCYLYRKHRFCFSAPRLPHGRDFPVRAPCDESVPQGEVRGTGALHVPGSRSDHAD